MRQHAILLAVIFLGLLSGLSYAQAPVPFINLPLLPDATAPGGAQFTLTVSGTGFVSNSVVNWNGSALATQFVSAAQLTAIVPAVDIATANTGWVTVVNPAPGGGTSNVAFFTVMANEGNLVGFGLASSPPAYGYPRAVAVGDFNGDGKLDLVVTNTFDNMVSILLGDGTGNFTLVSSTATGSQPWFLAVGDFNGDGKLDLATANYGDSTVSILLGDGTGHFTLASSPATGSSPLSIAAGDFNGDGKLDLAVLNQYGQTVSILLGDGTGHFTLASSPATGNNPRWLAVGDFNNDDKLDLAVANEYSDTISILLGDGTGNFTLASSPATSDWPTSVAVGDFNGDGNLDLAVTIDGNGYWTVSILLGDGTGNFTTASSANVGMVPDAIAVGDFNGDGKLDLAVANGMDSDVSILLGDGTGNFTLISSPPTGGYQPFSVAVGDFNNDGKLDLAAANLDDNTVAVLLQGVASVVLSPTSVNFAAQVVGTSSNTQPVTLSNNGGKTVHIGKIVTSGSFSQTNNCPTNLPINMQCTISVIFSPTRIGKVTGALTIKDNAPGSPQKVPLTGVGTVVTLSPSSLNFGDQQVGTTSPPQVATLTNYGKAAVRISGVHITGAAAASYAQTNNCGTSLPAGGSCATSVTFTPETLGNKKAKLKVDDNGGDSPQKVALSGIGTK